MNTHEEFLEGFGDALGLRDPDELQTHYEAWLADTGMTEVERIDIEGLGYVHRLGGRQILQNGSAQCR